MSGDEQGHAGDQNRREEPAMTETEPTPPRVIQFWRAPSTCGPNCGWECAHEPVEFPTTAEVSS